MLVFVKDSILGNWPKKERRRRTISGAKLLHSPHKLGKLQLLGLWHRLKLHVIIASISRNKGSNKPTVLYPKNLFNSLIKPVLKCKQVDSNNFKKYFGKIKIIKEKKKKKTFFEFWKLGAVYFCTVKTSFQFSKIRGGRWRTTKLFFFCALLAKNKEIRVGLYRFNLDIKQA